jgi:hypothetical protein
MLDGRPARGRPGDTFVRAAGACLLAQATNDFATTVAARQWGSDRAVEVLTKAAVSPATITGSGWVDSFAATALPDFLLNIGPVSAGSALLKRCLSLTFNGKAAIKVPSITTSASGASFVTEGNPIPVRQFSIASGVTLSPRTFATISTFDREIFQHSIPSIESLIRTALAEDVGLALDGALFDSTAGDATRPAGLLVGISATTPTAAGDFAMVTDAEILAAAVAPVAANSPVIFVASPKQAARMRLSAQLRDFELFASSALADKTVIAIASNCLVSAIDPAPRFDVSGEAALVLRDDPTALGTVGTPNVVGAPARSLFQADAISLRMRFEVSWALRSSTGLAYMSAVNW